MTAQISEKMVTIKIDIGKHKSELFSNHKKLLERVFNRTKEILIISISTLDYSRAESNKT